MNFGSKAQILDDRDNHAGDQSGAAAIGPHNPKPEEKNTAQCFGAIGHGLGALTGAVGSTVQGITNTVKDTSSSIASTVVAPVAQAVSTVGETTGAAITHATALPENLLGQGAIKETPKDASGRHSESSSQDSHTDAKLGGLGHIVDTTVLPTMTGLTNSTVTTVTKTGGGVAASLVGEGANVVEITGHGVDHALGAVADTVQGTTLTVAGAGEVAVTGALKVAGGVANTLVKEGTSMVKVTENTVDNALGDAVDTAQGAVSIISQAGKSTVTGVLKSGGGVAGYLLKGGANVVEATGHAVGNVVVDAAQSTAATASTITQAGGATASGVLKTGEGVADDLVKGGAHVVKTTGHTVGNALGAAGDTAQGAVVTVAQAGEETVTGATINIVTGMGWQKQEY